MALEPHSIGIARSLDQWWKRKTGDVEVGLGGTSKRVLQGLGARIRLAVRRAQTMMNTQVRRSVTAGKRSKQPSGGTSFMPESISRYIQRRTKSYLVYSTRWGAGAHTRQVRIRFAVFSSQELADRVPFDSMACKILSWLLLCTEISPSSCSHDLDVFILRAPQLKVLPSSRAASLSPVNVNSGYATACARTGEIVVYRTEEWFKVFVHETFHAYGLDAGAGAGSLRAKSRALFPVEASHAVEEAYTETWARIINVLYCAQVASGAEYIRGVEEMLAAERMFAAVQASKVLEHMGTHYACIRGDLGAVDCGYKEETNVLAYYVLAGSLMNNIQGFLRWCSRYAVGYIWFAARPKAEQAFADMLARSVSGETFISSIELAAGWPGRANSDARRYLRDTLRMTMIECAEE